MAASDAVKRVGEVTVAIGEGRKEQGATPASSRTYKNIAAKDKWPTLDGCNTLYDLFERSVTKYFDCKCVGWRPLVTPEGGDIREQQGGKVIGDYTFLTYKETHERVKDVASALASIGVKPHDRVGMYAVNCPEWMFVLQACNRMTYFCVPVYDSLGENAVEYIIDHSEQNVIFTSKEKVPLLAKALPKCKKPVKTVVYFGGSAAEGALKAIQDAGVQAIKWDDFVEKGKAKPAEPVPPKADDPACIMYTSGTTGNPKGVVITHRNLVTGVASAHIYLEQAGLGCSSNDSMLSYLTLAHIFGRMVEEFALSVGASIGYWQGDVKKLTDDVAALKPSLFIAVPRVLDRITTGIQAKVKKQSSVMQWIINWAINTKIAALRRGVPVQKASPWLDHYVFSKFSAAFGGRLRFILSGGAPLAKHVEEYASATLCVPVFQGYGLTETCAASFLALPRPGMSGTVGPPLSGVEFKFEASTEMGYDPHGDPPRGEICMRGPMCFKEYYKDEEKTKEAYDTEGWFHTGDVGELTPAGCLKVIDRIKNMFKLAQGEYVAAEKLENLYSENEFVSQVWVYGNSYESTLVAVVVPESKALQAWAASQGLASDAEELCKDSKAKAKLLEELTKTGKAQRMKGFELVKAVLLEPHEWNVDNEMMTPSFKLKRPQLQKRYQKDIDAMYKQINAGQSHS